MYRKKTLTLLGVTLGALFLNFNQASFADTEKTIVHDKQAKQKLLGKHKLALQWISWDRLGTATVTEVDGQLRLKGEQLGTDGAEPSTDTRPGAPGNIGDYLKLDGIITELGAKEFKFKGKIQMRVSSINAGKPCDRNGTYTFALKSHPTYWRMQEINNPCDSVVDYVDLFCR